MRASPRAGRASRKLDATALRMIALAVPVGLRTRASGGTATSAAVARLATGDKAPHTRNRYAGALLAWEAYTTTQNITLRTP